MKIGPGLLRMPVRLLVTLAALQGLASATSIIVPTGVDWSRGESIWLKEDGKDTQAYFAGVILISLTASGHQYNRDSLCVDLFTDISVGVTYNTTIVDPMSVQGKNLTRVSWLIDNALLPTQISSYGSVLPQADWVISAAQGAGIQLAVWDIVHDGGDGFSAGRVRATTNQSHPTDPTVLSWARTYETLSLNQVSNLAFVYDNTIPSTGVAAQMLAGPLFADGGPVPSPENSTFTLEATALAGIGFCVLGKRRG